MRSAPTLSSASRDDASARMADGGLLEVAQMRKQSPRTYCKIY